MYCVKCGVRLQEGVSACPLCATPVWNPEPVTAAPLFPERYPEKVRHMKYFLVWAGTGLTSVACTVLLMICFRLYGALAWGGYAVFGLLLGYVIFLLPLWFRKPNATVFVCVDHVAAGLYLLYICLHTGGSWFLPFAFPVVGISLLLTAAVTALLQYTRGGRYFIFGGLFLLSGGFTMLVEFFAHIAFGTGLFVWSVFSFAGCAAVGLFLILAGIIRPLREYLSRRFFI